MTVEPADIKVADDKKAAFQEAFETSWDSVVAAGTVLNVTKALEVMAQNGKGLAAVWDKGVNKVKLASGCYVAKVGCVKNKGQGYDEDGGRGVTRSRANPLDTLPQPPPSLSLPQPLVHLRDGQQR